MDHIEQAALKLLDELQFRESRLLSWGMIDGFFVYDELLDLAEDLVCREKLDVDPEDLVESLVHRALLIEIDEDAERYRTRSAEGVRLFARLRLISPWRAWSRSSELVSDFRFVTLPRLYPARNLPVEEALATVRASSDATEAQLRVARALLGGHGSTWQLSGFQVAATMRILDHVEDARSTGTIVCAGTGSGKTLAFYIPAFMHIVEHAGDAPRTECLAIYPRTELLRDQLRTAVGNACAIEPAFVERVGRPLSIGVLYGSVPSDARGLDLSWIRSSWPHISCHGMAARQCPYIDCPDCGAPLGWPKDDAASGVERLLCSQCQTMISGDHLRLTRESLYARPPDILFTTTEMLNRSMAERRQWRLFGIGSAVAPPSLVLLDEVHTYGGVAGAQVGLTLRRWRQMAKARPHFVGLSATLADAPRFMAQLVGLYPNHVAAIEPRELEQQGCEHIIALRAKPGTATLSTTIQASMLLRRLLDTSQPIAGNVAGQRVFVFTDNLDVTNRLYFQLGDAEGWSRPHPPRRPARTPPLASFRASSQPEHGARLRDGQSWDVAEEIGHDLGPEGRAIVGRTSSQDAGVAGDADVVVATASLEVGFDDPTVGGVVQHQAPRDPAAYVQRKGRAGRLREMRPWTVVVLSDWGRDRQAYRSYEQLFSPTVPPRYLPIQNRHVLRMQAAFATMDWLAAHVQQADLWRDLRKPGKGPTFDRQRALAERLEQLLTDDEHRQRFASFLQRALGLAHPAEAQALLWEPPRSLLFAVWPTLLRRLERQWRKADGSAEPTAGHPMPEFVPRALFEDLNLPEVTIRVETRHTERRSENDVDEHAMPIRQALVEFAPGRVSRRFGVAHAHDAQWVPPPQDFLGELDIASFCPDEDAQPLGTFQYVDEDEIRSVEVFRPYRLHTRQPGRDIHERSDARPVWHSQVCRDGSGTAMLLPRGSEWSDFFLGVEFHTHVAGNPAEVCRFTTGADVTIREATPPMRAHEGRVTYCVERQGYRAPAALGFNASHDGVALRLAIPDELASMVAGHLELSRTVRSALFYDALRSDTTLDGVANVFQRAALAEAFIAAALVLAEREATTFAVATHRVARGSEQSLLRDVTVALRPADRVLGEAHHDADAPSGDDLHPLFESTAVLEALSRAAHVFGRDLGPEEEAWLGRALRATAGSAVLEAFQRLCPQVDAGDLFVELSPGPTRDGDPPGDEVWLTESMVGGSGFVEVVQRALAADPRRFVHLVEAELEPSDFEEVDYELRLLLRRIVPGQDEYDAELAKSFDRLRQAETFADKTERFEKLRAELREQGIATTHAVVSAVSLRLLRPGSSKETDRLLLDLVNHHDELSAKHGFSFDDRVFGVLLAFDDGVTARLATVFPDLPLNAPADRHALLSGLLWPRGASVRRQSLSFWNPYAGPAFVDRLLLDAAVPHQPKVVSVEDDDWRSRLDKLLLEHGRAGLKAPLTKADLLRDAALAMASEPIVSESLLLFARVRAYKRSVGSAMLVFDMPEALQ